MRNRLIVIALALAAAAGGLWYVTRAPAEAAPPRLELGQGDLSGFSRVTAPGTFELPRDHGPHFDYQTEWWYYTGNLTGDDGEHYGFQLTFFRRGLSAGPPAPGPGLATNQIYFAHFAVSDVAGGRHRFAERFSRGAGGLAGAAGEPYGVWLEDWSATSLNADGSEVRLLARDGDLALDLTLRAVKPLVAHGDGGLSPKSDAPGNASYYLSYTRMQAGGQLTVGGRPRAVTGQGWFDHEWSTSALGEGAVGWDWFSLQLDDGRELMLFQIRRKDGSIESVSGGTLIEADGSTRRLGLNDFRIETLATWRSPATNAAYPARWRIAVPSASLDLTLSPHLAEQEMRVTGLYWEGAVSLSGISGGSAVAGNGYVELTGYAASLEDSF